MTSDERRRVAEGLRGLCDYHIRYAEQFYEELRGIVMPNLVVSFEVVKHWRQQTWSRLLHQLRLR